MKIRMLGSVLLVLASSSFLACAGRGTPPTNPAAVETTKATGALASVTVAIKGNADAKYKQALEKALVRAGIKVVPDGTPNSGLQLVLEVALNVEEGIDAEDDPSDPNAVGHEMAKYKATLAVIGRTSQVDQVEATPEYEMRWLMGDGTAIKNIMTKEEADAQFCTAGIAELVNKLVASENAQKAAGDAQGPGAKGS